MLLSFAPVDGKMTGDISLLNISYISFFKMASKERKGFADAGCTMNFVIDKD